MMSEKRLNERIGELADENDLLVRINKQLKKKNERLNDENEQLRQQLQEYKENWDDMVELATKTSLRNVELDEQIGQLQRENEQLRQQLQEKQEDEKLYAQEILELNKTKKEMLNFKQLGGDY